jgi:hypothetical protein
MPQLLFLHIPRVSDGGIIVQLGPKEEETQLDKGKEDDPVHDGKVTQVRRTPANRNTWLKHGCQITPKKIPYMMEKLPRSGALLQTEARG